MKYKKYKLYSFIDILEFISDEELRELLFLYFKFQSKYPESFTINVFWFNKLLTLDKWNSDISYMAAMMDERKPNIMVSIYYQSKIDEKIIAKYARFK